MAQLAVRFLIILLLLVPTSALAQDEPAPEGDVDVPSGPNVIVILAEGARAPFSGQLFDAATATRFGNRIVRYRMQIRLLNEELSITKIEHEASTAAQLRIVEASYSREIEGLRSDLREQAARYEGELARYRNPPFYESWGFAFGVGAVVVALVVGVTTALVLGL